MAGMFSNHGLTLVMCPIVSQGHSDGGKKLGEFLGWCMEAGVAVVTAFAFSTENWKRDEHEVSRILRRLLNA